MGGSEMEMSATSGKRKTLQVISSYNRRCHSVARVDLHAECWAVFCARG